MNPVDTQGDQTALQSALAAGVSPLRGGASAHSAPSITGQPALAVSPDHMLLPDVDDHRVMQALTIRRTEERFLALFAEGRISGTVHTCVGQEWVGIAVAEALEPQDYVFGNHRSHGHYLARTDDVEGLIAEILGRSTGVCGGRGGSQHLCKDRFFTNGVQGGIVPVSAGLALAQVIHQSDGIAVVFIGDGMFGEGVVYETFNMASKWSLPLLIVVEDNGIAQSTSQSETLAGTIGGRARAFGIDVLSADTWSIAELLQRAAEAVRSVRQTRTPVLLHIKTYRLNAHSKGDDDRDPDEVSSYAQRDILNQIISQPSPTVRRWLTDIDRRLDQAVIRAEAAPATVLATITSTSEPTAERGVRWRALAFSRKRIGEAIRDQIADAMARDDRIVVLGEDVRDPYGGAFKVTAGLSEQFGERVRNTPISEAGIVGVGSGLAMAGLRPVIEIMFGDFLMLAADQIINHAAKFAWMYNHQVEVPLVIRTPMGGYRGYGPTHSQSLEKHILGVPGTRVLALHKRYCPGLLYETLLAGIDRPTIVIENKTLYAKHTDAEPPTGYELLASEAPFPTVRLKPIEEPQLTVVAYGGLVEMVEEAIRGLRQAEDITCELLIPTQLYPLHIEPIAQSVQRSGRLLVVEEGQGFAGFGSEVIAALFCRSTQRPFRADRVSAAPCPIPASKPAETRSLPSLTDIIERAITLILSHD